ncbi:hypothetical protein BD413DRAFT_567835 [Trametes elegans]|nr:hypothetical protein BD413DRAFT_567835 [Trametes elegans]
MGAVTACQRPVSNTRSLGTHSRSGRPARQVSLWGTIAQLGELVHEDTKPYEGELTDCSSINSALLFPLLQSMTIIHTHSSPPLPQSCMISVSGRRRLSGHMPCSKGESLRISIQDGSSHRRRTGLKGGPEVRLVGPARAHVCMWRRGLTSHQMNGRAQRRGPKTGGWETGRDVG